MSELRLNCWRCWPTCQSGTWKSSSASIWTNIKTFTLYPKNTQVLGRFKLCINTYRI
ncbi:shufflon protein C, partial [Escherichia coli]|nr:shufflon protein C [Escherichia coli]